MDPPEKRPSKTRAGVALSLLLATVFMAASCERLSDSSDTAYAKALVKTLDASLIRYKTNGGTYPTTGQGLRALVEKPATEPIPEKWTQYIEARGLVDPWGNPCQYRLLGDDDPLRYEVWSWGPDGKDGTGDDISSKDD